MNDTHGAEGKGWYGFDLDGTLAVYDKWQGIDHIGEPVKPMVDLIKKMHDEGKVVKILTARVAPIDDGEVFTGEQFIKVKKVLGEDSEHKYVCMVKKYAHEFIGDWCEKNLGFVPEITHEKDHLMIELYDDRVKQVLPNEGTLIEDIAVSQHNSHVFYKSLVNDYRSENLRLNRKLDCKFNGFLSGLMLGSMLVGIIMMILNFIGRSNSLTEAEKNLDRAIHAYIEAKTEVYL